MQRPRRISTSDRRDGIPLDCAALREPAVDVPPDPRQVLVRNTGELYAEEVVARLRRQVSNDATSRERLVASELHDDVDGIVDVTSAEVVRHEHRNASYADVTGVQDLEKAVAHQVNLDRGTGSRPEPRMLPLLFLVGHPRSLSSHAAWSA